MASDSKPTGPGFLRKVARFVANPTTDWAELNSRQDIAEADLERSELKAMIERKRRNDFVRKREFDMLRKLRREGLSSEQLAALAGSSRLDDSEARLTETAGARSDLGVKAKIDEIEQQMVGDGLAQPPRRSSFQPLTPTQSGRLAAARPSSPPTGHDEERLAPLPPLPDLDRPLPSAHMGIGVTPLSPAAAPRATGFAHSFSVEVSEAVHDPELDEAVIAFANADFAQCEQSLSSLIQPQGPRAQHAETWLVLFDLYRATGEQAKFEALALEFAHRFGWSAPQWFSLPQLVVEASSQAEERRTPAAAVNAEVGWVCPPVLDVDAVARLRSQSLQLPQPWVFDWSALQGVDPEAATQLSRLMHQWADATLEMRWVGGDRLLAVLADAAPTGSRDADPALWLLRLQALRLADRPDAFDEAAIDYCVTYEVSPPSWERSRCRVRISDAPADSQSPSVAPVTDVSTVFLESTVAEDPTGAALRAATVELSGQLAGDIGATLAALDRELDTAAVVNVACARLIRVDFIAAGDLLNWVLAKRSENRSVSFVDTHRLIALFFGAMGINEHAKVRVHGV